jgi:hypothetical protein
MGRWTGIAKWETQSPRKKTAQEMEKEELERRRGVR